MCQYNNSLTRYSFSVLQCGAGFSYEYSAELVTAAAMDKDKRADNESES